MQNEGYEVTTFLDGISAMARIRDNPHLWILDIMIPDIDGYQIIKEIKENNKNVPVIFMSARNEELDRVVGLELGSDDYLSKPFLPRKLVIRTNKLIERIYGDEGTVLSQHILIIGNYKISLEKKIKQLLYLNTLDYVLENNNENIDVNLNRLLSHIIGRFEVVNSTIEWELDIDKLIITGNPDKIQVSIENILDNGLRYAETKISVKLKSEGSFVVLEIYNDGSTISSESVDHIFENFYKDKTGNFGLGLAISKKIIYYHKGEIKVVNRDKGVSFIIKYPVENICNQHH